MLKSVATLSLVLALICGAATPTLQQSLSMKQPIGVRISPDGHYVAYLVQQANWDENAFNSQIWVADTVSNDRYQLTSGKKTSGSPRWSPDSKRIAFTSDRDGKAQIYIIGARGGEASQLTSEENGVIDFDWSPDGKTIAYLARPADSKGLRDRKDKYGEFEVIGGDYAMQHMFAVSVPDEVPSDPKQRPKPDVLTSGDKLTVNDLAWSPDSTRIAFTAARDPDLSSQDTADIYVVDVRNKAVKKLVDTKGPDRNPLWSPDGKQIAFVTSGGQEFFFYSDSRIALVPADGGTPKIITDKFDEDPNPIGWGEKGLYFNARQKTENHLFVVNPATGRIEQLSKSSLQMSAVD